MKKYKEILEAKMSKQTAVDWLFNQMSNVAAVYSTEMSSEEMITHAKQMEKEQIETAYQAGDGDAYNLEETKNWAEQYYNETYEK